ncbi:cytochrome c3 family protein [bacterium]|nr:cytochrome c3 family protein [bacterium]
MPQLFRRRTNTVARLTLVAVVVLPIAIAAGGYAFLQSAYVTGVGVPRAQPVPFSHAHHVGGLGIDCRYCHTSVEKAAFAGMPATETCMTCHSQIWADSPMLAPVRESYAKDVPLQWTRVTDLPDYVYFDHHIHVAKGIGCTSCHGRVDEMPLTWKAENMRMAWCLSCHRAPERHLRPREAVFDPAWQAPRDQLVQGKELLERYHVNVQSLSDCSTCHR